MTVSSARLGTGSDMIGPGAGEERRGERGTHECFFSFKREMVLVVLKSGTPEAVWEVCGWVEQSKCKATPGDESSVASINQRMTFFKVFYHSMMG